MKKVKNDVHAFVINVCVCAILIIQSGYYYYYDMLKIKLDIQVIFSVIDSFRWKFVAHLEY